MKLDPRSLFEAGGFACFSLVHSQTGEAPVEVDARAVFVTAENVTKARELRPRPAHDDQKNFLDVRYGDILITRKGNDGKPQGLRFPAGKDAGILISAIGADGFERRIPVSGPHMLSARQALIAVQARGQRLDANGKAALQGLRGIFDLVAANPDSQRFPEKTIGQAFLGKLLDQVGNMRLSISEEEFGRRARADLLRSRISAINPDHPDGISSNTALEELLQEVGIRATQAGEDGGIRRYGHKPDDEPAREFISGLQSSAGIFDNVTKTSMSKMRVRRISPQEFGLLSDEMSDRVLTGLWVEAFREKAARAVQRESAERGMDMVLISDEGLDICAFRDNSGRSVVCSWPSSDRIPLTDKGSEYFLNISPQEIPKDAEILRLKSSLDHLVADMALENVQGRVGHMG